MRTVAVVPVKDLREAKTRLAGVLSPRQRTALLLAAMRDVLAAISRSGLVERIAVISPEPQQLDLPGHITAIRQMRHGLNSLLEQGREWAIASGAEALMVVFADLPLLSPADVAAIIEMGTAPDTIVLAPDRHEIGTNIMLAHPPALARFGFGADSFRKHREWAHEVGARLEVYSSGGVSLDIDTPDDLAWLQSLGEADLAAFREQPQSAECQVAADTFGV